MFARWLAAGTRDIVEDMRSRPLLPLLLWLGCGPGPAAPTDESGSGGTGATHASSGGPGDPATTSDDGEPPAPAPTTDSTDAPGTTAAPSTGTTADAPPTSSSGAVTETATTGDDTTTSGALPTTTTTGATSTGEATTTTTTTASTGESTDTGVAGACDDGVAWVRHIAGGTQTNMFNDLAIDAEDNAIAVGHFYERETDFGGGNLNFEGYDDAFVVKYGPSIRSMQ